MNGTIETTKRLTRFLPLCLSAAFVLGLAPQFAPGAPCSAALAQRRAFVADNGDGANPSHKQPPQIYLPGFITYWGHDASGYHPCIILALESDGVTNMAGVPIQLQAQFRVLAEGLLTIGHTVAVFSRETTQRQIVTEPMRGKRAFELPLNQSDWPVIECKVLAKVGDATSEESQVLLEPCRIQSEAMSDEDATSRLSYKLTPPKSHKPIQPAAAERSAPVLPRNLPEERPLVAKAGILGEPLPKPQTVHEENFEQFFQKTSLPGLGDDFYNFEKVLGQPINVDNNDSNWVWACYRKNPQIRIFVGSRAGQGKADIIAAAIDTDSGLSDTIFANIARSLSSKFRSERMAPPEHSVRYTSGGRVELTNIAAQSYRAVYFTTQDKTLNKFAVVAVSRQPGSLSEFLKEEGVRTLSLRFLLKGLGAD